MLVHSMSTTSESKMQECLEKHTREKQKAFVLTTRIPDDEVHLRYNVFIVVANE